MLKKDRISPRTKKPIRPYSYHVSKRELAKANKARSDSQIEIWKKYTDKELETRKKINARAHNKLKYRRQASAFRKAEWQNPKIRKKRLKGLNDAQTPEHRAKLSAKQKEIYKTNPGRKRVDRYQNSSR